MNASASASSGSRAAFRRLLFVGGAVLLLIIFAYGWTVTDIDFSVPQQPQRQENVGNALRELLSPRVFDQDYEILNTTTSFGMSCSDGWSASAPAVDGDQPYIIITPTCAESGEVVTIDGYNFAPDSLARVNWIGSDGERRIRQVIGASEDNFVTENDGTFQVQIDVPRIRGSAGETHTIEVQGRFPIGSPRLSETTLLVLEKMSETIFLALIATAVSILPSAILSFLAAHNLMRPIKIPLGNLLVTFILFPVGAVIGALILGGVGKFAFNLVGAPASTASAGVILLFGTAAATRRLGANALNDHPSIPRTLLNAALGAVAVTAGIGLLGGVSALIGRYTSEGDFGFIGVFLSSVGQLIDLIIVLIAAVVGAFTLSSMGTTLTRDALKEVSLPLSRILGAVLGGVAGIILLGAAATVSLGAAWMGLLPPIIAAALGASVLPSLFQRFFRGGQRQIVLSRTERLLNMALSWIGALTAFVVTFAVLNVGRALVEGSAPPRLVLFNVLGVDLYLYVAEAMLIGAVLGAVTGGIAGTRSSFPAGSVLYTATRTILNALRSIEPLIMGLVFVIWVGIGPFAGVLALALHSIASLGKLYSEQIESIDSGPIEALESTGANRLQTIMYAVVPQIIPPYIAFTMYRWDINVRMSTIIGFVGGGGIGFVLQQQINLLRYRDAGVAVLAIAIVVSILDYASAAIRERYT
ncbi:MAG: ABC transporter permease subunit [Anaerolineae bacterium]|nr:ABC transporter permease subunit [Anaerolineae bacterium]